MLRCLRSNRFKPDTLAHARSFYFLRFYTQYTWHPISIHCVTVVNLSYSTPSIKAFNGSITSTVNFDFFISPHSFCLLLQDSASKGFPNVNHSKADWHPKPTYPTNGNIPCLL